MRTLAESVAQAERFADSYLRLDGNKGTQLVSIGERINDYRGVLIKDYRPGGDAWLAYDGFGDAMHSLANDYQTTDQAQAARYDRLMDEVELNHVELPKTHQAPTVILADYTAEFVKPPEGFPGFDVYNNITDKLDKLLGFEGVAKRLGNIGILSPIEWYKQQLEGDWKQIGRAVGALKALSRYWSKMSFTTRALTNSFNGTWVGNRFHHETEPGGQPSWSGHAASAATQHLFTLASKAGDHYDVLEDKATAITLQMFAVNDLLDQAIGLVEDFAELLPVGGSVGEQAKDFFSPDKLGPRLAKMIRIAAKMLDKLRLIVDALAIVISLFSELSSLGGVDFPRVSYAVPDVNGA